MSYRKFLLANIGNESTHHYCELHPRQENAYYDMDLERWACNCCASDENHMRTVPVMLTHG